MDVESIMDGFGRAVDAAGVLAIIIGAAMATLLAAAALPREPEGTIYATYRERLGRSILLGPEFLVAADIIRTVAIAPTFESAGVLALIVRIRTFLSFTLQLEITGGWPWQKP